MFASPQPHCLVRTSTGKGRVVWTKRYAVDTPCMPVERLEEFSGVCIPQPHRLVRTPTVDIMNTCTGKGCTIWTERHAIDPKRAIERAEEFSRVRLP